VYKRQKDIRGPQPGEDNASIYRSFVEEVEGLAPDDEALAWENYLREYPRTLYKERINERLVELERLMFSGDLDSDPRQKVAAGNRELFFAQPVSLENIDPITKLRAGFEIGLPNYVNFLVDYEYQILRELSAHIGIRNRHTTGWSIEPGARYAILKSARTRTLVTAIGDVRIGTNPFFPALRPQLAVGQQFGTDTRVDVQIQGGSDMTFIQGDGGDTIFEPRLIAGGNVTFIPADRIRIFAETSLYMKDLGGDELSGAFQFNIFTFGIKIMGPTKRSGGHNYEIGAAANAPYAARFWGPHRGSVMGDLNYFL